MHMQFRTPDQIELEALQAEVELFLEQFTEKQREFFFRLYPSGIKNMDREKLRNAVGLCQRTVGKNLTGDVLPASLTTASGEAATPSIRKALEAERDYWADEVADAAADLQEGCPFTDAVKDRIAFCSERAERINRVLALPDAVQDSLRAGRPRSIRN
jgi:hypothetical protein